MNLYRLICTPSPQHLVTKSRPNRKMHRPKHLTERTIWGGGSQGPRVFICPTAACAAPFNESMPYPFFFARPFAERGPMGSGWNGPSRISR